MTEKRLAAIDNKPFWTSGIVGGDTVHREIPFLVPRILKSQNAVIDSCDITGCYRPVAIGVAVGQEAIAVA